MEPTAPSPGESFSEQLDSLLAGMRSAQLLQAAYDDVGWRIQEPSWAKTRHMLYHLMKVTAELAVLVEAVEHAEDDGDTTSSTEFNLQLREHRHPAADLDFHAAQIANLANVDLGAELVQLWARNAERFAPDSAFADISIE